MHVNEIVFAGDLLKIGRWRLPASHQSFRNSGPTQHYLLVFPRTSTWIQHADDSAFVADPNVVTLYNRNQEYTRRPIARVGDWSDYYAFDPDALRQIISVWDPAAADADARVLRFTHAYSDARAYLTQRAVYRHARRGGADPLFVEEAMLQVASRILRSAYGREAGVSAPQRDLVEHARAIIARGFCTRLTLTDLARATGSSVFHLCRLFRASTGSTIHAYRNQVRLRAALERVLDSRRDLSAIALDLGYSTHSHFTAAFRASYGRTPSAARRGE